jgi:type I restriction-modification system DNA methylase subunit
MRCVALFALLALENDYMLNIPRYVDTSEEEKEVDIAALQVEIDKLERESSPRPGLRWRNT